MCAQCGTPSQGPCWHCHVHTIGTIWTAAGLVRVKMCVYCQVSSALAQLLWPARPAFQAQQCVWAGSWMLLLGWASAQCSHCSHRTSVCTCAPALNMISHEISHPFILLPADTCGVSLDMPFPEKGREKSSHISAENPREKQRSSSHPVEPLLKAKISPAPHKHLVSSLSDWDLGEKYQAVRLAKRAAYRTRC